MIGQQSGYIQRYGQCSLISVLFNVIIFSVYQTSGY